MNELIKINNISKSFYYNNQKIDVLKNINLNIKKEDFISIIGPSGSGKTTLLNIIGTLDDFDSGEYFFKNNNIIHLNESQKNVFRNINVGFIHQFHYLIPELTTLENIILPELISGKKTGESINNAKSLLKDFGLNDKIDVKSKLLSGGEQQRISIARSMINKPDIIIADEMTGNLDEKNTIDIFNFFLKQIKKNKQTLIFVTHNNQLASKAKIKYSLENGTLNQYS